MKVNEIISPIKQVLAIQPRLVQQQARVGNVVKQIAASDAAKPATEMDKVLAMQTHCKLKKQADKKYAANLRQQLANAEENLRHLSCQLP